MDQIIWRPRLIKPKMFCLENNEEFMTGRQCISGVIGLGRALIICVMLAALHALHGCASDDFRYENLDSTHRYYRVQQGDTLYGIAKRVGHDYRKLAAWNHISYPYTITPGQSIRLFPANYRGSEKSSSHNKYPSKPSKNTVAKKNQRNSKKTLKINWQWPIRGVIAKNFSQTGRKGLDIFGKYGEPVRAAAGGKIVYSGRGLIGYGNLVIVKHSESLLSAYANNSRLLVREGDAVQKGQAIAEVGKNAVKRSSLHFEIRKDGKPVNPILYLPKP